LAKSVPECQTIPDFVLQQETMKVAAVTTKEA